MEILLASVIFVITAAMVYITINAVRQPVLQKERALTAALFGQQLLEDLRSQVDAADINASGNWTGNLALGVHGPFSQTDAQGIVYNEIYTVACGDGSATCDNSDVARAVTLSINFPDTQ